MKRNKLLSLLLVGAMTVSMLAGCASKAETGSGQAAEGTQAASQEAGGAESAAAESTENPTITFMCIDIYGKAMGNVGSEDVLKAAEDYTGINVDFNWVANDSYSDILGVTLMDKANMPMVITYGGDLGANICLLYTSQNEPRDTASQ